MTRKSIGSWSGLGLLAIAACTGGGAANDFGAPESDAPPAPGAPPDPNAPPASTTDAPFGGVAPPPGNQPPSGGTSAGGTGGTGGDSGNGGKGGKGGNNCTALCNETAEACQAGSDAAAIAECVAACDELGGQCFPLLQAYYRCGIENGCMLDACAEQAQNLGDCAGPPT
jgi:hypothetical protein